MSLDREIEKLFAVNPSPEFVAKVRERVATEPAPAASWWAWRLVPAGAGLAALVAVALLWPFEPAGTVSDVPWTAASAKQAGNAPVVAPTQSAAAAPVAPAPAATRAARPRARAGEATVPGRATRAEAEIVISPEDARAFRLLLARVREGFVVTVPEGELELGEAVVGPPWIEIEPVVIEPLAQLAQDEGGRQ